MSIFTKDDLRRLYESEVTNQQNKCIRLAVEQTKQNVFSQVKKGKKSVVFQIPTENTHYNDEWVKTQILTDLERIFPDSNIDVSSESSSVQTLTISIDWA
jgi:hypothetical protein